MPPSSMSTLVLIVRLLVMRLFASPELPVSDRALELDLELHQRAAFVICGVILRMVPTSSRWTVVNGFTSPLLPVLPVLRELAGDERHFLRDLELGFLVVHRDRGRRGDDVGVRVALDRAQHRGEVHAGGGDAADAEGGAGAEQRAARSDGSSMALRQRARGSRRRPAAETCRPECACRRRPTTRPSSRRARRSCSR